MPLAKVASSLSRNGVLVLSELRMANYPMFKYLMSNYDAVITSLSVRGVEVLDDLKTKRSPDKIRLYLKYHFGDVVNMSELRKNHRTIYNYISELGTPREVVESLGFSVVYKTSVDLDEVIKHSSRLPRDIYNRVYYRAKKMGMSVQQYLKYRMSKDNE